MDDYQGQYDAQNDLNQTGITMTPAMSASMLARAQQLLAAGQTEAASRALPSGYILDPQTGQIREKTWWEKHGDTTKFMLEAGASVGGGFLAGGLGAAHGAAGGGASVIGNPAFSTPLEAFPGAAATGGGAGVLAATQAAPFSGPAAFPTAAGANLAGGFGNAATSGAVAGGTASTLDRILKYAKPALAGGAALGGALNQQPQSSPEMERLLAMQRQRLEQSNPLYEQMLQSAFGRMPTSATSGLQSPSLESAASQVPPTQAGGNYKETQGQRDLLRQQEIRMKAGDPVYQAIQRLAQSRMGR